MAAAPYFGRPDMAFFTPVSRLLEVLRRTDRRLVLVPDTEWYYGVNDRMGVVARAAGATYFGRARLLESTSLGIFGHSPKRTPGFHTMSSTEAFLMRALKEIQKNGSVELRSFPTLGAVLCCVNEITCKSRGKNSGAASTNINGKLLCDSALLRVNRTEYVALAPVYGKWAARRVCTSANLRP